jgi:hypothetical protein
VRVVCLYGDHSSKQGLIESVRTCAARVELTLCRYFDRQLSKKVNDDVSCSAVATRTAPHPRDQMPLALACTQDMNILGSQARRHCSRRARRAVWRCRCSVAHSKAMCSLALPRARTPSARAVEPLGELDRSPPLAGRTASPPSPAGCWFVNSAAQPPRRAVRHAADMATPSTVMTGLGWVVGALLALLPSTQSTHVWGVRVRV